mmetsp:Transcript_22137/g.54798  ORF Transcript_22137/g.54798 Transcript_22137/m.54798 type:complete len:188 (+) Transcript_22137:197-760(+)
MTAAACFSCSNCCLQFTNPRPSNMGWYDRWRRAATPWGYVFFMEHDVEWSGDLRELLQRYEARTESFLCSSDVRADTPEWAHHHKRSAGWAPEDSRSCLVQFVRFSVRLLDLVVAEARQRGNWVYCEIRAASTCHVHREWCTMGSVKAIGARYFGSFGYEAHAPQMRREVAAAREQGLLQMFHPAKW